MATRVAVMRCRGWRDAAARGATWTSAVGSEALLVTARWMVVGPPRMTRNANVVRAVVPAGIVLNLCVASMGRRWRRFTPASSVTARVVAAILECYCQHSSGHRSLPPSEASVVSRIPSGVR
jgi:hypothetical protein